ncbi:MAG: gliding motility-associated protein GldE [Bacteroidales bacterium]|nr:gliding motility-associated protein GldE [Bacteroidales bacterium]
MEETEPYPEVLSIINSFLVNGIELSQVVGLIVLLMLFFISAMVSGSEVAYFSLSPNSIEKIRHRKGAVNSLVVKHLSSPDRLLATILIANNFVNVGIVVLSSFISATLFQLPEEPGIKVFILQVVVVTFLILFFSEILPKIYASRYSVGFARFTAYGLQLFTRFFWPFATVLIKTTSVVDNRLVKKTKNLSIDELSNALELTENTLVDEKGLLKGIVKFGNIDVSEIMRSRVDVVAVEVSTPFSELVNTVNESGYSRIPIYENTFDEIKGILYIKDLLPHLNKEDDFKWQNLLRPTYFVPESKKINMLLKEFQSNRIHMAIVVDEYGGSSGIITMEDILEEIVGEITDESDDEEVTYQKIDSNNYIFEGKTLLNDFYKVLEYDDSFFDEVKGEADTLAGLILELRGEIPKKEDKLSYKNLTFSIKEVDKRRIKSILVTIKEMPGKYDDKND